MKFNPNQRYTRWSIRRLSVGVASVVVASGFFVLVGQPSSARADVVNPTPAQVVPDATSVSEKSDLPAEVLKKAVDVDLSSEQSAPTPKASVDTTSSPEKADVTAKDQVVAPKEEVQARPESKKQTEDAVKPAASEAQSATTPAEVQKGVADNTKDTVDVPATYLDKANFPGPFTAGVNQVIPYEFFAGDGMLTRLILKASDKAPWSDNGSAKNPALPPVEKLGKGLYFYEVDLAGTQGKSDKELLDLLKQNGTKSYKATIKVYGAKDGKADLSNLVATKELTVNLNGLTTPAEVQKGVADNTKDTVDVPATYLDKANFPGPFTAGVNQVIPYEFFAGDGMLTRLILKASDKAPWSDNGSAKNPALPPVEKLGKGLYFYEVDLAGTQGKSDKDLLDLLKQNGTHSYKATIKVYGAKDGKADLSNLVATKDLTVNLNGHQSLVPMQSGSVPSSNGSAMTAPMMNSHQDASNMKSHMPAASQDKMMPNKEQDKTMNTRQPMATPSMKQDQVSAATSKMPDEGKMASNNKMSSPMMADQMKGKKDMLPYTGEDQTSMAPIGFLGLALAGLLGGLSLKAKKEEND
ncbi:fibronectin-binding SSURE repeat-containing protein [Streptococcus sp. DTU_2020_1001019_1_SI_AUS_MUR_006]|uniref:SSURE domain-containing protein n=1 Tax=Streptococcus sp. DTU_2020_1001019_1_SI_AUS_MUR_006 TaxID=3077584 RepID=UPI0028EB4DF6|nr:fibronectin-binding SSURE repeat-containing protein [Streptococcus sp. DTU_2020_1001019_1_SI_AUS_MUR_006]WNS73061.1 fibronectin-binding SSURE repeat-containing protein [Streptococcus sp. DTU_2020_1001019_1_SI_AUS_MUR_006]